MLKYLHIKNFKGWKDTGKIEFAPITLFMGSNSSGKSSIGQFLMLLKQSSTSADRRTVLFLGDSNSVIELGGPVDMLYEHDVNQMLEFEYGWDMPDSFVLSMAANAENTRNMEVKNISFFSQIAVCEDKIRGSSP